MSPLLQLSAAHISKQKQTQGGRGGRGERHGTSMTMLDPTSPDPLESFLASNPAATPASADLALWRMPGECCQRHLSGLWAPGFPGSAGARLFCEDGECQVLSEAAERARRRARTGKRRRKEEEEEGVASFLDQVRRETGRDVRTSTSGGGGGGGGGGAPPLLSRGVLRALQEVDADLGWDRVEEVTADGTLTLALAGQNDDAAFRSRLTLSVPAGYPADPAKVLDCDLPGGGGPGTGATLGGIYRAFQEQVGSRRDF